MLDALHALALAAGALILLALAPLLAWWSGVWFRARGAAAGTFAYGFAGSTLDRAICAGLATAPWLVVAPASPLPLAVAAAVVAVVFALSFAAVALAHGNYFALGEKSASASTPEPPMAWLLGPEPAGLDEDARTRFQIRGAAIRIALLALPALLAAPALAGPWLLLLLPVLGLALVVAKAAASARRDPVHAAALKRALRVDRWADDQGMKPGWELLEFMAGAFAGAVSAVAAAAALAVLAMRAW